MEERMDAFAVTDARASDDESAVYIFKKTVISDGKDEVIKIFANARYKLYANGVLTAIGPLKGMPEERYYDEVSVPLKKGENEIRVLVLSLKEGDNWEERERQMAVYRTGKACLAIEGELLTTGSGWQSAKGDDIRFFSEPVTASLGINERVTLKKEYDFSEAVPYMRAFTEDAGSNEYGLIAPGFLLKRRTIPMMYFKESGFISSKDGIYDAGGEICAFIRIRLKGTGTFKITYAECYSERKPDGRLKKGVRSDPSMQINGDYDEVKVTDGGYYEPYWMRTFRYVKTECDNVTIESIDFVKTGYPLSCIPDMKLYNETDEKLIEISKRTLFLCMHETFTDCPYYEQLQYLMDTYLQTVFSSRISPDCRLIKKAINDFALSQRTDGMLLSRYPSNTPQIIPGFALMYPFMVKDYVKISGDTDTAKKYIPVIERLFYLFSNHKDENGMIKRFPNWNFIDWSEGYTRGVPNTDEGESYSALSLLYAASLKAGADICRMIGRFDEAEEFTAEAEKINETVTSLCYDEEKGMYASSPSKKYFAQHENIWAVLSGAAKGKEKDVLYNSKDLENRATFGFAYFYFRALEKAGLYEKRDVLFKEFRNFVSLDCSTVPEAPNDKRSECHAWGSVAIFEFSAMDLGIRDIDTVKKEVLIKPYIFDREGAEGSVMTPCGEINVHWEKKDGFKIKVTSPSELKKTVVLPSGEVIETYDEVIVR